MVTHIQCNSKAEHNEVANYIVPDFERMYMQIKWWHTYNVTRKRSTMKLLIILFQIVNVTNILADIG